MGTAEAKAAHFGAGSRTKSIPREPVERPQSTTSTISSWIVPLVMRYQPSSNTQKLHRMTLYIMMMMMMMIMMVILLLIIIIIIIIILRSIHFNWYAFKIQTKIWACLGPLNHPTFGVPKLLCSLVDLTPRQALKACDTRSQRSFWQQFCSVQREMHRSQAYMLNLGGPLARITNRGHENEALGMEIDAVPKIVWRRQLHGRMITTEWHTIARCLAESCFSMIILQSKIYKRCVMHSARTMIMVVSLQTGAIRAYDMDM